MPRHKAVRMFRQDNAETGVIRKSWKGKISIALIYPNRYAVGLPNLGFQTVYSLFNSMESVVCERVFLPDTDDARPLSLESSKPLTQFDIIAFSISFENDYLNVPILLNAAGIPPRSSERDDAMPLVIAGGVACIINPEPIAHFIDCFLIGEAEMLLFPFISHIDSGFTRDELLCQLASHVPGAYIPAFYEDRYTPESGFTGLFPLKDVPEKISRVFVPQIDLFQTQSTVIASQSSFGNSHLVEVSRGCPHGCRFCSAGFVYRPPRFRSLSVLESCIHNGIQRSDRIGLVGAAVSDLPDLDRLCKHAQKVGAHLSFSSLRADALTPSLIASLAASGVKTATIAPDAGSERMRQVINKGITELQIREAATALVSAGIPNLKLYFMIGLPTETPEDVDAIVILCRKIKDGFLESSRAIGHIGSITVSINAFIPKPFTPFQWAAMDRKDVLKKKFETVLRGLKSVPNMRVEVNNFKESIISAMLSKGDRRFSALLMRAAKNRGNWRKTLREMPQLPLSSCIYRERCVEEPLPWDHIDNGIDKTFLQKEYDRALNGKKSPPCSMASGCQICGVCKNTITSLV